MTGFADEDELYRYIGGIFETALADPELEPKLPSDRHDPASAVHRAGLRH